MGDHKLRATIRLFWRIIAVCLVGVGLLGAVLPGLPTVVFLLMAAWCAGKGWPALEDWLLNHHRWGLPIRNWRAYGAVPRKAKVLASVMMSMSLILLWLSAIHLYWQFALTLVLAIVLVWLWLRPELSQEN